MRTDAVVRIFATTQEPDYDSPWQARVPSSSTGSGVVIGDRRILTGAHVVANSTFLQVQKIATPDKVRADVVGVCHDCDLALLKVRDDDFMDGVTPATIGELPDFQDRVAVVGFPVGGDEVSITEGVVSRLEVTRYTHSQRYLLAVTVDAAINEGNSGGPVFSLDGQVVGIAFQKLHHVDNIGEMVPPPIVKTFLESVGDDNGSVQIRIPAIGIATQGLENPALRRRSGLGDRQSGLLVLHVEHGSSADGQLRPGDVILEIEGHHVANNNTVQFQGKYRTRYDVFLGLKKVGDSLDLCVLRDGARHELTLTLEPAVYLVPRNIYDRDPAYFVYGGMVFQPLTRDLLSTWGDSWWEKAPREFMHYYESGVCTADRREVVALTQIFADEINVGYEDLHFESVVSVNGESVADLRDFVARIESATDLVEIRMSRDGLIVMEPEAVEAAKERILGRYRITRDRFLG